LRSDDGVPVSHRVSREEAIARLEREPKVACRLCALAARNENLVAKSAHASVILSRYPVRWGHLLVVPHAHVERFTELAPIAWSDASLLAHRAAVALERALTPSRCYVASLGTSEQGLPMTFAHIHMNVIPVDEPGARPRDVLTWQHGVYDASEDEWSALLEQLRAAWG
jgi:diadenosine tetraphosphate (Ap4A) HIT family hydrolase